jgi:peptidylprolyl isomerase
MKTPSGLSYKIIKPGKASADRAKPDDAILVNYTGWTTDGKMFDTSLGKGVMTLPLNRMIAGWREAVPMMAQGETRRIWIPEELAYKGAAGRPKGTLVFEIELVAFSPNQGPGAAR